ncbi:MAG: hypothetical protein ACOY8P_07420 [Thermodesulfobacteriota bacterium]
MARALIEALTPSERESLERTIATGLAPTIQRLPVLQAPGVGMALSFLGDSAFVAKLSVGYVEGFAAGFLDGAKLWRDEFTAMLRLVGVGTIVGVAEFFVRPLVESDPEGLMPQSQEALSRLNSLRTMKPVLLWLDAVGMETALDTLRHLIPTADELTEVVILAGRDWLLELCGKAQDARAMGAQCGRLFGRLALELMRGGVEPFSFGVAGSIENEVLATEEDRL